MVCLPFDEFVAATGVARTRRPAAGYTSSAALRVLGDESSLNRGYSHMAIE
ncbi:hypothetical protein PF010_g26322 [Phytophthora fragariae]|uniref:Uncharacterized protein n=1 Tax=Phytophthora fragariae TaxID=53985 RepID=A0A6A3H1Q7_9STRA|nr:hypothetical protein PF011_g29033 [Phytophthora fragariae]KAE9070326.1 hypothetical protein PF010_g26322 [Phytophthora fragariae]